jgi:hypothetical protein
MHTIATATLATLTFGSVTPSDGDTGGDDDDNGNTAPGSDISVWQSTFTVGQRYVWLKSVQFRLIGSVMAGDVKNFRLYVDGVMVGSAVSQQDANGYVVFDLSGSPKKLETGGRVVKVMADIVGGSSKEFYLSIRQKSDVWAVDSQYNAAVLSTSTFPIGTVDNDVEIDTGTLTITKRTDSPSGDVVKDASGVVLARFDFKAAGERMKVENLRISNTSSNNLLALRNAGIFADGVQVGATTTLWEDTANAASNSGVAYAEVSLGSSLIVTPGTDRVVEIRADVFDASGTNNVVADQTVTANIAAGSSNIQRMTTLDYVSNSAQTGNQLTIKTGSFTAGKYTGYSNQSVVAPKTGVKLGHFTLAAASSEDVSVNTLVFELNESVAGSLSGDFTDGYVKVWNDAGSVIYTSSVKSTLTANTAAAANASNSFSVNFTMPKNKTYQVELWANVTSTFDTTGTADTVTSKFKATGTTTASSTSVTAASVAGQTLTSAAGSLTKANGAVPVAQIRNGGTTFTGYVFTLTAAYDDFTLDEVYVEIASNSAGSLLASASGAVAQLNLKDGSTTLASAVVSSSTGSASFTGLNLPLLQSAGTKTLTVEVQSSNVGVGANDTAGKVQVVLDGMKFRNSGGSITTQTGYDPTGFRGNRNYIVKGYPTFTTVALPTTELTTGTKTLFKTAVSATGGQISWNDIAFTVASNSTAGTLSNFQLWENGVDTGATASTSNGTASQIVEFNFATERVVSAGGSVTLELRVTVGGTIAATDSISTTIANPLGSAVTSDDATVQQATAASFVWSDQSSPAHATTTDDWFTDALVKTLAETQSLN